MGRVPKLRHPVGKALRLGTAEAAFLRHKHQLALHFTMFGNTSTGQNDKNIKVKT